MNNREKTAYSWEMYSDGLLAIGGTGPIEDFYQGDAPWAAYASQVTSLDIGEGITAIGARAFTCFASLKNAIFPKTLERISYSAFEGCTALAEVDIPDSLRVRFYHDPEPLGHRSLKQHADLVIGARAFLDTPWAEKTWGNAIVSGTSLVEYLGHDRAVEIPEGITRIAPFAFSSRPVSAVIFPETLKEIGDYTFEKAPLLTAVLPASLEQVGRGAFARTPFLYSCLVKNPQTVFSPETFTGSALFKPGDSLGRHLSREGLCKSTIYSVSSSPLKEVPAVHRLSFKKTRSFGTVWRTGDACRLVLRRTAAGSCLFQITYSPDARLVTGTRIYYPDGDPRTAAVLLAAPRPGESGGFELDSDRWAFLSGGDLALAASEGVPGAENRETPAGETPPEPSADWYQISCSGDNTVEVSETIFSRWMENHPGYRCA